VFNRKVGKTVLFAFEKLERTPKDGLPGALATRTSRRTFALVLVTNC
jgi:hypothetical protein